MGNISWNDVGAITFLTSSVPHFTRTRQNTYLHNTICMPKTALLFCELDELDKHVEEATLVGFDLPTHKLKIHRGPFLTSPLGAHFDPKGEVVPQGWILSPGWSYPLGVKFSVCPSTLLNSRECPPLGGVNIPPRGQISPLGALRQKPRPCMLKTSDTFFLHGLVCLLSYQSAKHVFVPDIIWFSLQSV
jgi:hypothetical protein